MNSLPAFTGACHCGRLKVRFETALDSGKIQPRQCDCTFCRKHGAAWISDAHGHLQITAQNTAAPHRYRQGSGNAQFLLCPNCGVLIASVFEDDGKLLGVVNVGCLDTPEKFGAAQPASPQRLNAETKIQRWRELWTPAVIRNET